ncbi:HNH endonuclease family protein [Corynebacterium atypicum]|uniref:HNH endonuclease family protein n=1 Tax=Corynebacterium atypicum TaxID=191610 RepID=UPI00068F55F3|nr:HNH endonuclease family protein [Corynebacterium atypicum]
MNPNPRALSASFSILVVLTVVALAISAWPWFQPVELPRNAETPGLKQSLERVRLVSARPEVPGYARDKFGSGWRARPRGCTTRQAVIAGQLAHVTATPRCRLLTGIGRDPYSGNWMSVPDGGIEIDHVFALSAAWDMGAADWEPRQRIRFANDAANLVAVSREENQDKLDQLPAQWLPSSSPARCWYSRRVAGVAADWQLALTHADARAMRRACRTHAVTGAVTAPVRIVLSSQYAVGRTLSRRRHNLA